MNNLILNSAAIYDLSPREYPKLAKIIKDLLPITVGELEKQYSLGNPKYLLHPVNKRVNQATWALLAREDMIPCDEKGNPVVWNKGVYSLNRIVEPYMHEWLHGLGDGTVLYAYLGDEKVHPEMWKLNEIHECL